MNDQGLDRGISRRHLLLGLGLGATALAAGCTTGPRARILGTYDGGAPLPEYDSGGLAANYGPIEDGGYQIPAINPKRVDPKFFRKTVAYDGKEAAGTLIVDPGNYYVYRVEGDGSATRYGANVGRDGFRWSGDAYVGRKSEWATWTPPREMIKRQPEVAQYARGMPGGLENPLGARTLHLYQNGAYTLYTIYASSDPESIGSGVTSGCVGLLSQDMIHLYQRTPVKTKVVVLPA